MQPRIKPEILYAVIIVHISSYVHGARTSYKDLCSWRLYRGVAYINKNYYAAKSMLASSVSKCMKECTHAQTFDCGSISYDRNRHICYLSPVRFREAENALALTVTRDMNIYELNCDDKFGWKDWQPWGACAVSCGLGLRVRRRTCKNEQEIGCQGRRVGGGFCSVKPCG